MSKTDSRTEDLEKGRWSKGTIFEVNR